MKINMVGAFVRNYPHGTEIAFSKGFRQKDADVRTIDPSREGLEKYHKNPDATIIFKWVEGEHRKFVEDLPGKKIVYQPDDLWFPHIRDEMLEMSKLCPNLFCFSPRSVELGQRIFKTSSLLRLTADPTIYYPTDGKKEFDVCFVANISNEPGHASRRRMAEILTKVKGIKAFVGTTFDVRAVRAIYAKSKIVLHHATDAGQTFGSGYGYQCRHFEAGLVQSCFLGNRVLDEDPLPCVVDFSNEEELLGQIENMLSRDVLRKAFAVEFCDHIMMNHMPAHRSQEIINLIEGTCL